MPQQTRPNLQTNINTDIADNVTGAITAGDVRVNMINMTDSVSFLTGSNSFDGDVTVTGSLIISGSSIILDADNAYNSVHITGGLDISRDLAVRDDLTVYDETDLKKETTIGYADFSNYDFSYQLNVTASSNSDKSARFDGGIVITGSSTIVGDITGSAFTGSFVGDGSALTGITSTIADGSVTNIKLANDSVTLGTTEIDLGTASTTLAGLTDVKVTGSLTVSGSGNTNILGDFYVYGPSPSLDFFSTAYTSDRMLSIWAATVGANFPTTEIDPGNVTLTINGDDYITLRNNLAAQGLSREEGMRFTRLSFETGTITNDGIITIPKDVTGTVALELKAYTVASLPVGTVGDRAYVTDATSPTYLGTLTGGGVITCPVFYNGSAWVSA